MSSRYNIGPYGVGNYSAGSVYTDEIVVVAAYVVAVTGNTLAGASAALLGAFSASAKANALASGRSALLGEYTLYAEPRYVRQLTGEASVQYMSSLSARGSVRISGAFIPTVTASYAIQSDPFMGKYWNPNENDTQWSDEAPLPDIWTKQSQQLSPWSA